MNIFSCLCIFVLFSAIIAFIPHPVIRFGGQAQDSITHTEIVQLGFIRSLARFFIDVKTQDRNKIDIQNFKNEHTIDELYQLAHPDWTKDKIKLYSYPLKSIIDAIQVRNVLVDLNPSTKNLPSAHFDSESFNESNHRIMRLRIKIIEDVRDSNKNLDSTRGKIGDLLHTLQDFYSHSNWIEMGKTEINPYIGIQENIGRIAEINQATCHTRGCKKVLSNCNIFQAYFFKNCPMEYYDCKENIVDEINKQGILTSGYVSNQFNDKGEPVVKPSNVEKCSHGSVMDKTSHQVPIGGINKDAKTPMFSPHYYLHDQAAKFAIEATERFFNDLRKDIGDTNFDRLFAINPTEEQIQKAAIAIKDHEKFHFLTSTLSIGLSTGDINFDKTLKQRIQKIISLLFNIKDDTAPTYDLSDSEVDKSSVNIHAAPLLVDNSKTIKRRQFGRRRYKWIMI
ncbi:unnamed protein product [Rotaria sordida]|uniref:VWA7 N-terminal domain-containing protein n=1 Tax=Rotaria sordida TaxID=392033 RepID=A0A818XBX6_9BILA|nr:unnamed protein product [Rotaria sordida]